VAYFSDDDDIICSFVTETSRRVVVRHILNIVALNLCVECIILTLLKFVKFHIKQITFYGIWIKYGGNFKFPIFHEVVSLS